MRLAWAFFKRDAQIALSYRVAFVTQFCGKLMLTGLFYFMARTVGGAPIPALERYGGDFLAFLLIGIALSDCVLVSLMSFATQIREAQTTGTLEATLMSPVRLHTILMYSSLWDYFMSATGFVFYLLSGVLVFGLKIQHPNLPAALAIFVLTVVCFMGVGMFWAGMVLLVKRGESIRTVVGFLMVIFSGVFFPSSMLPEWVRRIAAFIPLTDALDGMRLALLRGYGVQQLSSTMWHLCLFAVVLLTIGIAGFNGAVRIGKHMGSLTQY